MTGTTLNGVWRDLKCTTCKSVTGFTIANLDEVMDSDYQKNYHCDSCDQYTNQELTGTPYELINGERIYTELALDPDYDDMTPDFTEDLDGVI
jgi:hypothetical protein